MIMAMGITIGMAGNITESQLLLPKGNLEFSINSLPKTSTTILRRRRMRMRALVEDNKDSKVVLPPRLCTLRAFADSGDSVMKPEPEADRMPSFFNSLAASIDHAAKFKDWEILSGRLAMIVFAAAINVELLTGNSLFHKMDVQKICEFGGVCMASIVGAAGFAWASCAKTRVGDVFSERYNEFVDTVIDQLVDGLFYEEEQD
uniref:Stress enhanced protein 2 n=1 Tax=Picea sitchensis TaxID=3332 RepID=A9NP48_PICSI|nr:unknown [Picea sitchensis]